MDYRFLTQKTLSLINTSFILLFFSTNISAFETNSDSKITANLEVTGVLKLGSVDSSSDGIITSITDSSDSTVPTAGAVKDYVDTQIATNSPEYALKDYVDAQIATNNDSIIASSIEVTGPLKLGSVDSTGEGIVSSITDNSDSTLPTTGAVKDYVDTQIASNPSEYALKDYVDAQIAANNNSLIASSVEVTGGLKVGWVDSSSSGIVTTISNSSNSTIPTTGAVKAYLDAQVAGSSGGYPSEVGYWVDAGNFSLNYCRDKGAGWRIPILNEVLNVVPPNTTDKYIWTTNPGFAADQYIAVRVTDGRFVSLNAIGGLAPDGWNGYYVCVR